MHAERYSVYCNHHRCTLCIKTQKPIHVNCVSRKPSSLGKRDCRAHNPNFIKQHIAQNSTHSQTKNCHTSTTTSSKPSACLSGLGTSQKRCNDSIQIHIKTDFVDNILLVSINNMQNFVPHFHHGDRRSSPQFHYSVCKEKNNNSCYCHWHVLVHRLQLGSMIVCSTLDIWCRPLGK